jgi:AcrR family transcriptional regulator
VLREAEPGGRSSVEETRLRIFAAARTLYARKGSRGTTTREVADLAGVNEATLFRHFGTKQQLLSAMLDHYSSSPQFPEVLGRVRHIAGIEAQLRAVGFAAIDSLKRKEDLIKVSMAEEIVNPEGSTCAWRAPIEARRLLTEYFAEKVASKELRGDPQWLARAFMSLFFALIMARGIWAEETASPADAVESLVELFLNGARTS